MSRKARYVLPILGVLSPALMWAADSIIEGLSVPPLVLAVLVGVAFAAAGGLSRLRRPSRRRPDPGDGDPATDYQERKRMLQDWMGLDRIQG